MRPPTSAAHVSSRPRGPLRPGIVFAVAWFAVFLICAAWSLASPLSSGPDESSHEMKAAASARGVWTGPPGPSQGLQEFRLPADVADVAGDMTCFAFKPWVTADCAPPLDDRSQRTVTVLSGVGGYNPTYYVMVGWPTLVTSGDASYYGVRLMSSLVNSFFVALVFLVAAWMPRARAFTAFVAVALTPMVLYLSGIVNPNGLEITGCAALAALTWSVVHDPDGPPLGLRMTLIAVSGILAGSMRTVSPVFVLGIVVAILLTVPMSRAVELVRRRPVWIAGVASALLLVPAVIWTIRVAAPAGFIPSSPDRPGPVAAFWHTVFYLDVYGENMIGVLGWLDTHLSRAVLVGWSAAFGFVVLAALLAGRRRALLAPVLLMAAVLLLPALVQAGTAHTYGYIWQGRYTLPLLVPMVLVCGFVADRYVLRSATKARVVAVVIPLWIVAQASAFVWAYRRYSVGEDGSRADMLHGAGWQAPGGFVALGAVFLVGLVVLGVLSIALSRRRLPDDVGTAPETTVPPEVAETTAVPDTTVTRTTPRVAAAAPVPGADPAVTR